MTRFEQVDGGRLSCAGPDADAREGRGGTRRQRKGSARTRWLPLCAGLLALGLCTNATADETQSAGGSSPATLLPQVLVVRSTDNANYVRFVTGFAVETKLRYAEVSLAGNEEQGRKTLTALKGQKPSLVLTVGTLASRLVKEIFTETPMVFALVPSPEKWGLVGADSATGIALNIPMRQQLATLKILAPNTKNVGVMYNPRTSNSLVAQALEAAKLEGLNIVSAKIDSPDEVPDATRAFLGTVDALWMVPDQTVMNTESFKHLLKFTFKNKVPFFSVAHQLVATGALVSLSPDYAAIGAQAGKVVQRLLNEKISPKSIPISDPEGLDIAVNLTTAKRIGVECDIALEIFTFAATRGYPIKVFK